MTDFKIRKGLSTQLFTKPGVVNDKVVIEENCWYLCTDIATLYLGARDENGILGLKQINIDNFSVTLDNIVQDLDALKTTRLYQKIETEDELPTDFMSDTFNPNIVYYKILKDGAGNESVSTFIFDASLGGYLCTAGVVSLDTIQDVVTETVGNALGSKLEQAIPEAVRDVFETTILCGGSASGTN